MRVTPGELRQVLEGKVHWRFGDLKQPVERLADLRRHFDRTGAVCTGETDHFAGTLGRVTFEVRLEPPDAISVFVDYGRRFRVFPIAVTTAGVAAGAILALRTRDLMFLWLGALGLAIGMVGYAMDTVTGSMRLRHVLRRILDQAERRR